MKKLIIVRDGYCDDKGRLNDQGVEQIRETALALRELTDNRSIKIISSPVPRAEDSAEIISQILGKKDFELNQALGDIGFYKQDNEKLLSLTKQHMQHVDIVILVTNYEYAKEFPAYFGAEMLGVNWAKDRIMQRGQACVINCDNNALEYLPVRLEFDEEYKLIQEKKTLEERLQKTVEDTVTSHKYFQQDVGSITIKPCPKENREDLVREGRLPHNFISYDDSNRRYIPEISPEIEKERAYVLRIKDYNGPRKKLRNNTEDIIDLLGGEESILKRQAFTFQQIEQICLTQKPEEGLVYYFFFRGTKPYEFHFILARNNGHELMFEEQTPIYINLRANDVLFLKVMPEARYCDRPIIYY